MIRQQKRLTIILLLLGVDKRDYSSCNVKTLLYSIRDYAKSVNDHEILTESNRLLSDDCLEKEQMVVSAIASTPQAMCAVTDRA
ncbi:hypothetical protein ACGLD7_001948, partial [Shigella flexneri]